MKGKTRNALIIIVPVSSIFILGLLFTFFVSPNDGDNLGSHFELVDPDLSMIYIFGLDKNFSVDEIVIYDHNGTEIFRGDLNKSLLNTTLYLELTLKEFIGIYAYNLGWYDKSIQDVFIQVADQLKE